MRLQGQDWWQAGHASIIGERHEWSKPKQEAADRAELTKFVEEKAFKRIRLEEVDDTKQASPSVPNVCSLSPALIIRIRHWSVQGFAVLMSNLDTAASQVIN